MGLVRKFVPMRGLFGNAGDLGSIPGLGRSPGVEKGYPPQYSGLEKSMDCIIHGVTKSQTQLSDFCFDFSFNKVCTFEEMKVAQTLKTRI